MSLVATHKNPKMALHFLTSAIKAMTMTQKLMTYVLRSHGQLLSEPAMMTAIQSMTEVRNQLVTLSEDLEKKIDAPMTAEREHNHKIKNRAYTIVMSIELGDDVIRTMIAHGVNRDGFDHADMIRVADYVAKHGHSDVAMKVLEFANQLKQAKAA